MTRVEKIRFLTGVKERQLTIADLEPTRLYVFCEMDNKPGYYLMDGKEYTGPEFLEFEKELQRKSNASFLWHERKTYPETPAIILIHKSGQPCPSFGTGQPITLNIK